MRARAPAPPTVWVFGVFSIVPLFIAAWVYCYGPLNLRGAGLLGLLGLLGLIPLFRRGGNTTRTVYVDRDDPRRVLREEETR